MRQALQAAHDLNLPSDWQLSEIQENAFRLQTGEETLFLKWVSDRDFLGRNEIAVNQKILPGGTIPVPRLRLVMPAQGGQVAVWEWLDGEDLRAGQRQNMPQAFTMLGEFHAEKRHAGTVYSPVTHQPFASVPDLLAAELRGLCSGFSAEVQTACASVFKRLEVGYPTVIHGDMHPGNIILTRQGLCFTDWGYALSSLNLFDLDYIQVVDLDGEQERNWWTISAQEAPEVLSAYYAACGLKGVDGQAVQHAVMVWAELRSHLNARKNRNEAARIASVRRVKALLGL